jgi:hypothetical protein
LLTLIAAEVIGILIVDVSVSMLNKVIGEPRYLYCVLAEVVRGSTILNDAL